MSDDAIVKRVIEELQKQRQPVREISLKENISIAVSVVAIIMNVGVLFYFGGRIEQRVTNVETGLLETRIDLKASTTDNARQDVSIASQEAKYGEINRQLSRLETALTGRQR